MEILFISHKFPPTIGGMEKQSYELISHAAKHGVVHQLVHTGVEESKFSFFWNLKSRVKKILKDHPQIDIIHLNDGLMGLFTLWLKSYTDIPVVITFHGLDLVFPNAIYQRWIRNRYVDYDAAICVSGGTAQEALKRGFPKEKVYVVPNGVDLEIANASFDREENLAFLQNEYGIDFSKKKIIALLGRPVKRKGFSWFLQQVVPQLEKEVMILMIGPLSTPKRISWWSRLIPQALKNRIELLMGGLNDEAAIRDLLQQPELKNKVLQTGRLPYARLLSLLRLSDLFVMPNIKMEGDAEGFGLVALEASLCETVVLASNLEGIPEAIQDQKNGYLLPSANAPIWKERIEEILANPVLLEQKGQEFQSFTLANYSWQKMAKEYLEVFEQRLKPRHESKISKKINVN